MSLGSPTLFGFLLVLFRCGALISAAPLFGARPVPARVKVGLAVAVTIPVFLGAGAPAFRDWTSADALLVAAVAETIRGLAVGFTAQLAVEAASAAGSAISLSMGLGFGAVVDPIHGAESTAVAELLSFTALAITVTFGLPREAVAWLCRSVVAAPPGALRDLPAILAQVVGDVTNGFAVSVRIAYPVMVAVTSGHLAFGLLNRVTPQLGIGNVGFAVAILAGGGALFLVAPAMAAIAADAARRAFLGS